MTKAALVITVMRKMLTMLMTALLASCPMFVDQKKKLNENIRLIVDKFILRATSAWMQKYLQKITNSGQCNLSSKCQ